MSKVEQILQDALSMAPSEKALVAHCLIASLDETDPSGVEQEWLDLARQRAGEVDRGEAETISWEELKRRVRGR